MFCAARVLTCSALVRAVGARPLYRFSALAFATPSRCLSSIISRSNWATAATTLSISLPVGVLVSIPMFRTRSSTPPRAGLGATPVAAAFRGPVALVRREGPREGPGADASLDYRQGADRGLDHRRHELSKEGQALGGRHSAVLGAARQAGQLPSRGVPVARERRRELPDRV